MLSYHFDPVIANSYKKITTIIKKNTMFPKKAVNILCEDCHYPKFSWEQSWILRKLINFWWFYLQSSPTLMYGELEVYNLKESHITKHIYIGHQNQEAVLKARNHSEKLIPFPLWILKT